MGRLSGGGGGKLGGGQVGGGAKVGSFKQN